MLITKIDLDDIIISKDVIDVSLTAEDYNK